MLPQTLVNPAAEPAAGQICRFQLANGLRVVMLKSHHSPVVAVDLWYNVGSRDEVPGKSGFAHLFEHMMFQGSANVGKSGHMKLINDVGGSMNGSTSKDRTNYYEIVPANQLQLALWLEADRMRSLALTEENFENQRDTVKEERKSRIDNAPYAPVFYEMMDELSYENWAYKHSVIGSMADLDNASLQDVTHFHRQFYCPNNAVLAIAGDMQVLEALKLVEKYFGDIPPGETPPPVDLSEPAQQQEKRLVWEDPFAPLPGYMCSFHVPERGAEDYYALEFLEKVLFDGESSRLYQRLVEEEQLVLHLYGGMDGKQGPGSMLFFGQLRPGNSLQRIEEVLDEELQRLQCDLLSERELQKIKNQFKTEFAGKLEKVFYKAEMLCFYTTLYDDPGLFYSEINHYLAVTAEDIRRVAQTWLHRNNRSVIEIMPSGDAATAGGQS